MFVELADAHSPEESTPSMTGGVPVARPQKKVPPPSRAGWACAAPNVSRPVNKMHAIPSA
jgi:hypothetical protein